MRLRNILVLCAFTAMSVGLISCGKKAEEAKPADSTMAPAPAPAPAPTTTTTTTTTTSTDTTKKDGAAPAAKPEEKKK